MTLRSKIAGIVATRFDKSTQDYVDEIFKAFLEVVPEDLVLSKTVWARMTEAQRAYIQGKQDFRQELIRRIGG